MQDVKVKLYCHNDGSLKKATVRVVGMREPILVRPTKGAVIVGPHTLTNDEREEAVAWVVGAHSDHLRRLGGIK